ncbi:MAG: acyl-CoA dehydrogenase family protein [Dehalococcoidia bacterium]
MTAPTASHPTAELPPAMEALRAAVRDFADREVRPRVDDMERDGDVAADLVAAMGALGYFGAPYPERWGGSGLGELGFTIVQEELSKAHTATGLVVAASTGLAARLIYEFGNDDQRERYLVPLAHGELVGAFCLTEPSGGSDVPAMQTRAERDGDEYVLTGEKAFVTNGGRANAYLVFAKTDPAAGRRGISLFVVDRDLPGVNRLRLEQKMGLLASDTAHMLFDGARVPRANLIGEEGGGFTAALSILNKSRIGIAAMCLGVAREAVDLAWRFAHERAMFGGTLADQQVTQHAFADMAVDLYAVESILYRTAMQADAGANIEAEASICKILATEAAQRVVDRALQMHGGAGYLRDSAIERLYRDIRVARVYEGANEVQRNNVYRVMRHRRGVPAAG